MEDIIVINEIKYKKVEDEKYVWKPGMFGATEESYELLEVNAKVIMNGDGEVK